MPSVQPAIHMICRLLHGTCIGKMLILFSNMWSPFHISPISVEKNGSICCAYNLIQNLTSVCGFQHNTSLLNYVLVPADYGYPNKISCILILTGVYDISFLYNFVLAQFVLLWQFRSFQFRPCVKSFFHARNCRNEIVKRKERICTRQARNLKCCCTIYIL